MQTITPPLHQYTLLFTSTLEKKQSYLELSHLVDLETPVWVCKTPESHLKQPVLCSFSRHPSCHGGLQWKVDLAEDSYSWL